MRAAKPPFRETRRAAPQRSAQEAILALWRGADWAPLEKANQLAARPAALLVTEVVQQLGLEKRRAETEVFKAWASLIDPTLAAHAHPTGLRNGTLFVAVDHSVWLEEIVRYRQREILERIRSAFGRELVKKISFRIG